MDILGKGEQVVPTPYRLGFPPPSTYPEYAPEQNRVYERQLQMSNANNDVHKYLYSN